MNVNAVEHLAQLIIENNHIFAETDKQYIENKILAVVGDKAREIAVPASFSALETAKIITDEQTKISQLLDLYTPLPSAVNREFWHLHQTAGPASATDYFHELSIASDYLKVADIAKNIKFTENSKYGQLEITINLSKPEKTTAQITAAKSAPQRDYPECLLCFANEGYLGGNGYPERSSHRLIRLTLNSRPWALQFSPYEYFTEHVIVIDEKHEPMKIDHDTFINLLDFVDQFPNYFIGSNADLPIIGGSMLAHEHYQGGKHIFPLERAKPAFSFSTGNSAVHASFLNWPVTTIKLESTNRAQLLNYADKIHTAWLSFDDPEIAIKASDGVVLNHSLNPIVRKTGDTYVLYLLLRDNNTSRTYPDGIFHVHPEYQHIKQENIGLIEAMGLAILPGRLKNELKEVEKYILNQPNSIAPSHKEWADTIKQKFSTNDDVSSFVKRELGTVFAHILENTGVFKDISAENEHIQRFINSIN